MKPALKLSLLANAFLVALACYLARHIQRVESPSGTSSPPVAQTVATQARYKPSRAELRPFHWSQLESPYYRVYISNLRAIGCPAQTVRDIISADVDTLYAKKREQFHLNDAALATGPWSRSEETALIARLLGDRPAPQPAPQQQQLANSSQPLSEKAAMPLVFQKIDLDALKLQEGQREGIEELRQTFLAELGTNQDPNDPAYYERWKKAQSQVDSMLPGLIGGEAFMKMQASADDSQTP